jgi:hypothetical protein
MNVILDGVREPAMSHFSAMSKPLNSRVLTDVADVAEG